MLSGVAGNGRTPDAFSVVSCDVYGRDMSFFFCFLNMHAHLFYLLCCRLSAARCPIFRSAYGVPRVNKSERGTLWMRANQQSPSSSLPLAHRSQSPMQALDLLTC